MLGWKKGQPLTDPSVLAITDVPKVACPPLFDAGCGRVGAEGESAAFLFTSVFLAGVATTGLSLLSRVGKIGDLDADLSRRFPGSSRLGPRPMRESFDADDSLLLELSSLFLSGVLPTDESPKTCFKASFSLPLGFLALSGTRSEAPGCPVVSGADVATCGPTTSVWPKPATAGAWM